MEGDEFENFDPYSGLEQKLIQLDLKKKKPLPVEEPDMEFSDELDKPDFINGSG